MKEKTFEKFCSLHNAFTEKTAILKKKEGIKGIDNDVLKEIDELNNILSHCCPV